MWSSFDRTSPVSGSKCVICSTSSPKNEMRYAVSECDGWISTMSPFTRKRPRPSSVSLRGVLDVDQFPQHEIAVGRLADREEHEPVLVLLGRAEAVDARHRGDDDRVSARQKVRCRRVAQPVDVVVPRAVLLDVEVGLRDVRLRLVVVVVGDEVLDRVRREELAELVAELGGERLVVRDHKRRLLDLLDQPRHRRRLAGARRAEQRLVAAPPRAARPRAIRSPPAGRPSGRRQVEVLSGCTVGTGYPRRRAVARLPACAAVASITPWRRFSSRRGRAGGESQAGRPAALSICGSTTARRRSPATRACSRP